MSKFLVLFTLVALALPLAAQTHTFCPLDGNCNWTGIQTFSNTLNSSAAANFSGPVTLSDTTSISGTLSVSATSTFSGTSNFTGTFELGGVPILTPTGTTGTGLLVYNNTPTLVTPVLGAATGTSVALGGGTPLTSTNQTGTGSLCLQTNCNLIAPTVIGIGTGNATLKLSATNGGTTSNANLLAVVSGGNTGQVQFQITDATPYGWQFCRTNPSSVCPVFISGQASADSLRVNNDGTASSGSDWTIGGNLIVGHGLIPTAGAQTARFGATIPTAGVAAGDAANTTFTWPTTFNNTNYTVICQGETPTGSPVIRSVSRSSATQVTVGVVAVTSAAASFAAVDCIAWHDNF